MPALQQPRASPDFEQEGHLSVKLTGQFASGPAHRIALRGYTCDWLGIVENRPMKL